MVGAVFLLVLLGLLIAARALSGGTGAGGARPVADIQCDQQEQLATHYHAHLDIIYKGQPVPVPGQIGISSSAHCLYWLHTHDDSGVIHIEAPKSDANRKFTLGDFFQIWHQPLSPTQVATLKVGSGEQVKVWVDGQPYSGDPTTVVLKSHEQVVIEIGPPFTEPPPTFNWPPDLPQ